MEKFDKQDFLSFFTKDFLHTESLKFKSLDIQKEAVKVCVIVSKKFGNACTRNKIKRKIKESIRVFLKENPEVTSKMVLIVPKKRCFESSFDSLKNEVYKIFFHCRFYSV